MKLLRLLFTIILPFSIRLAYGQIESIDVIQTVIDYDKDISEKNIIVSEFLEDFKDTSLVNLLNENYGGLQIEEIKYLKFGDLNVRLIPRSALFELRKITKQLNDCKTSDEESFDKFYQELVYEIFDRDLCIFNKVLFSKNKDFAIVKYQVETGNALGLGEFSVTYLVEKKNGKWNVNKAIEFEI
nr:hypothetical protein [uncultured Carboxylicivirga sp.]